MKNPLDFLFYSLPLREHINKIACGVLTKFATKLVKTDISISRITSPAASSKINKQIEIFILRFQVLLSILYPLMVSDFV